MDLPPVHDGPVCLVILSIHDEPIASCLSCQQLYAALSSNLQRLTLILLCTWQAMHGRQLYHASIEPPHEHSCIVCIMRNACTYTLVMDDMKWARVTVESRHRWWHYLQAAILPLNLPQGCNRALKLLQHAS